MNAPMSSLIDAETLQRAITEQASNSQLLIIDLCGAESYTQGHIPGAVAVAPSELSCGVKPAPGKLPSVDVLAALLRRIGLRSDTHVVVYDNAGSSWAGRMIWTLDLIGHSNASLLDGGLNGWTAAGYSLTTDTPEVVASTIDITVDAVFMADKQQILARLGDEDFAVWDARSTDEYTGEKVLAARGGHIPGAVHSEWTDLTDADGRIKDLDVLREYLLAKGLTPDKEIVTHCQTHRRSGLTYFVAKKLLQYPAIKAYPGSWSEWGNAEDTPVES